MSSETWAALADDAETLARLHDRELDAATLAALREVGFPDNLALLPQDATASEAWDTMRAALGFIADPPQAADLDALAVEYAAIYLTGAYGASPAESVWLDQDHIACQQPMFELREIYLAAGLAAENWRKRPDDHLVLQLQYIAHMLRRAASADFLPMRAGRDHGRPPAALAARLRRARGGPHRPALLRRPGAPHPRLVPDPAPLARRPSSESVVQSPFGESFQMNVT